MRSNSLDMVFGSSSARTLCRHARSDTKTPHHEWLAYGCVGGKIRPAAINDVDAIGIGQSRTKQNGSSTTSEKDIFGGFCQVPWTVT